MNDVKVSESVSVLPEQKPEVKLGNRKQRRRQSAFARRVARPARDSNHWFKRIAREMQECGRVQDLILSGKVDKLLV